MIQIFYKSYEKDFKLLNYSLKSLVKNVIGYDSIVLCIPINQKHLIGQIQLPEKTIVHFVPEYGDGYLYQQVCKLQAWKYSNADYILFADSDCIFNRPIDLNEFLKDGKPEILYTEYAKVEGAQIWQKPTEDFIKEPVPYEFMRRNCLIYHRETLVNIDLYEPNLEYIVMNSKRFSEFNAIGAYAFKYEREKYNFVNTDEWVYNEPKAIQLWSWAQKNGDETHRNEYKKSIEVINKVLDLNLTEL